LATRLGRPLAAETRTNLVDHLITKQKEKNPNVWRRLVLGNKPLLQEGGQFDYHDSPMPLMTALYQSNSHVQDCDVSFTTYQIRVPLRHQQRQTTLPFQNTISPKYDGRRSCIFTMYILVLLYDSRFDFAKFY